VRIGYGFDAHRLVEGRPLVLGGVDVPAPRGCLGHSDADALAHALCDALLGGAALGDLGTHFPSSDPQWKDADSILLLRVCAKMVHDAGYSIENVDATIVLQSPQLATFLTSIRERIADALGLPFGSVSVKAKTSEGMGYTGDGSGLAVHAVASLS